MGDCRELLEYFNKLFHSPEEYGVSRKLVEEVVRIWDLLRSKVDTIPLPIMGPGGELGFQMAWNTDRYYIDIDISEEGNIEWYARDKVTGVDEGSDDDKVLKSPDRYLIRWLAVL